jgi:hypothetical protein
MNQISRKAKHYGQKTVRQHYQRDSFTSRAREHSPKSGFGTLAIRLWLFTKNSRLRLHLAQPQIEHLIVSTLFQGDYDRPTYTIPQVDSQLVCTHLLSLGIPIEVILTTTVVDE